MSTSNFQKYINQKNPKDFSRVITQPFKDPNFYYGCYRNLGEAKVTVNGEDVPIYNFSFKYKGKSYNMNFWFVRCEDEPTVRLK